jgi:hypothetical protein
VRITTTHPSCGRFRSPPSSGCSIRFPNSLCGLVERAGLLVIKTLTQIPPSLLIKAPVSKNVYIRYCQEKLGMRESFATCITRETERPKVCRIQTTQARNTHKHEQGLSWRARSQVVDGYVAVGFFYPSAIISVRTCPCRWHHPAPSARSWPLSSHAYGCRLVPLS